LTVDDDIDDEVNNHGDTDSDGDAGINDDIDDDIDGIDRNIDEGRSESDGDDLNDSVNQLEEWPGEVRNDENINAYHGLGCGNKRPHSSTDQWRKPVKVHVTTGAKPKAGDYEVAVQRVLGDAIPLYRGYLSSVTPYPGAMDEMRWAKRSWADSCEDCETWLAPNDEIIKLVSVHADRQPTCHAHLS